MTKQDTKGIAYKNWMYLEIKIPDIGLILLDRVTYTVKSTWDRRDYMSSLNSKLSPWEPPSNKVYRKYWFLHWLPFSDALWDRKVGKWSLSLPPSGKCFSIPVCGYKSLFYLTVALNWLISLPIPLICQFFFCFLLICNMFKATAFCDGLHLNFGNFYN